MSPAQAQQTGSDEWFAWRPVRLSSGGFAWLRMVRRQHWTQRCGDHYFPEWSTYALLP